MALRVVCRGLIATGKSANESESLIGRAGANDARQPALQTQDGETIATFTAAVKKTLKRKVT
jgi:hypothetical protein